MSTRTFAFLLCVFFAGCINAQQYAFRNITTDEGLPTSECYHISQDSKGYVWVGTNAGLGKYNGRTFKTFTTAAGLTDNIIFKTFEDDQGRLFYITGNARIGYLKNDTAYTLPVTDTLSKILSAGKYFIYSISDYDKDHFLISTQRGFYTLDKKTLSRLAYLSSSPDTSFWLKVNNGKASGAYCVTELAIKGKSVIYNLCVENGRSKTIIPVNMAEAGGNSSIFKYCGLADGRVLAGFANEIIIVSQDGTYETIKLPFSLTWLSQDKNGGVWICMLNGGLYYYPAKKNSKGKPLSVNFNDEPEHFFKGESPSCVLVDNENGVWVSTLYNGIYYCPNLGIVNYPDVKQLSSKLYSLSCIPPYMLTNGLDNKLFVFKNKKSFRSMEVSAEKNVKGAYSYCKKGENIYVAGYTSSYVLDSNFKLKKLLVDEKGNSMFIYNLVPDKDKKIIGIRFSELAYVRNDSIFADVPLPSRGRDIAVNGAGTIYLATNKGLLIREGDHLIPVKDPQVRINKLKTGPDGKMWICSDGKGVMEIDGTKIIKTYTTTEGLASDICYDIAFEGQKRIWIATNKGLCSIDENGKIVTYKKQNGLSNNEIFKVNIKDDELYVCTQKGLCVANLEDLHPNNFSPRIYISEILNNDKPVLKSSAFDYDQNNFEFKAEGISFQNPSDMIYEYRLSGNSTEWEVSNTGEVIFSNLTDGSYTFEVRAVNADGVKSEAVTYSFIIKKPFWKRIWFLLILALFSGGLIYLLFRWRVRIVRKKEVRKTYYNKMMADYHMSALRAQMNPHFIFNAINSIQHYILSNEKQYAYDYLAKFSKLIRQVLANSQNNTTTLNKEIFMLELYMDLEQRRFRDRFDYEICYSDELPIEEISIPVMLVQPFVENAIWHGIMNLPLAKKGKLSVTFEFENEILKISVADNGVGRKKAALLKTDGHQSVGMMISKERLEILKVLGCKDANIIITDLEDELGASGTRVDVFLTINN